jgi:hypothetical protein
MVFLIPDSGIVIAKLTLLTRNPDSADQTTVGTLSCYARLLEGSRTPAFTAAVHAAAFERWKRIGSNTVVRAMGSEWAG